MKTTTREFDADGKLTKETIVETSENAWSQIPFGTMPCGCVPPTVWNSILPWRCPHMTPVTSQWVSQTYKTPHVYVSNSTTGCDSTLKLVS